MDRSFEIPFFVIPQKKKQDKNQLEIQYYRDNVLLILSIKQANQIGSWVHGALNFESERK